MEQGLEFMIQFLLQEGYFIFTIQQMLQFVVPLDVLPQRLLVCEGLPIRTVGAAQDNVHLPTTGLHMCKAGDCAEAKTLTKA